MEKEIMVSIICNTYNQENYIRDALDSFLMQKTNFAFEVLVHDDASTDNTPNIIREYEEKYPDIVKPIYQKENQYSQRIGITLNYQLPRAKGKYLAWCEGDDYWTDPNKLQKQVDILEKNPDIDICTHSANMIDSTTGQIIEKIAPISKNHVLSFKEVIARGKSSVYVATSSILLRAKVFSYSYSFYKTCLIDYTIQLLGSIKGGMYFLNDNMSVYRFLSKGSFNERNRKDTSITKRHFNKIVSMLDILNQDTEYLYLKTIRETQFVFIYLITHINDGEYALALKKNREILSVFKKTKKFSKIDKFNCFKARMKYNVIIKKRK